ncbi:recombinase family protein [Methylobacterium sp. GC_Met_1]
MRQIARALNQRGIPTVRGGEWSAAQVSRMLDRAA